MAGALLAWALTGAAQDAAGDRSEPVPEVLQHFLDHVDSLSASFDQELRTSDRRLVEISSGTLSLKRPNRFRWNYTEPLQTLIVTDGHTLWMYDVDIAQVTRADIDEAAPASPAMLLSGDEAVRKSFDVVGTEEKDGIVWIDLEPNFAGSEFSLVRLGFNGETLAGMQLVDGLDQTTSIAFKDIKVNPELDDSLFEFTPPRGVSVLGTG